MFNQSINIDDNVKKSFFSNYLALSGTSQGVAAAMMKGALMPRAYLLQSSAHSAIQGSRLAPRVKKMAIDMFATNVRHFGPTYSRTVKNLLQYLVISLSRNSQKV